MFKLLIAAVTSLSLMFGAAETVTSQPGEPLYTVKEWSVQSRNRTQQQTQIRGVEFIPTDEPLEEQDRDQLREQDRDRLREQDCDQLQEQLRTRDRIHQTETPEPLHLNPQNPWTEEAPVPNSGYGPGPGTCQSDCTPEPGPHGNNNGH